MLLLKCKHFELLLCWQHRFLVAALPQPLQDSFQLPITLPKTYLCAEGCLRLPAGWLALGSKDCLTWERSRICRSHPVLIAAQIVLPWCDGVKCGEPGWVCQVAERERADHLCNPSFGDGNQSRKSSLLTCHSSQPALRSLLLSSKAPTTLSSAFFSTAIPTSEFSRPVANSQSGKAERSAQCMAHSRAPLNPAKGASWAFPTQHNAGTVTGLPHFAVMTHAYNTMFVVWTLH